MFKAKAAFYFALFLIIPICLSAQDLLYQPESAVYDSLYNRYFVSNWGNGNIIQVDSNGVQDSFYTDLGGTVAGLYIEGDILYAAANYGANEGLVGFDLATGELVKHVYFSGYGLVNGITSDTSGYIYVTDYDVHKIYKVNPIDETYSVFVSSGLDTPNGATFDKISNRLLVTHTDGAGSAIIAVNLEDSTFTTVFSAGSVYYDGLTQDQFGYYYTSSWGTSSVYAIDHSFAGPLVVVSTGHDGPADICYNQHDHIMAIPNFNGNRLDLVDMTGTHMSFDADPLYGYVPLEVDFTGSSHLTVDSWKYYFGDNDSAMTQSPTHIFGNHGMYDITLEIASGPDTLSHSYNDYIVVLADTMKAMGVSGDPGSMVEVAINVKNYIPLNYMKIPVEYLGTMVLTLDSISTTGCRADFFDNINQTDSDPVFRRATFLFYNDYQSGTPDMEPGEGPVLKLYFTISPSASVGQTAPIILDGYSTNIPRFKGKPASFTVDFEPATIAGSVALPFTCGDANDDGPINIFDVTFLITHLYIGGPAPDPLESADVNHDGSVNIFDITYLISFLYMGGPDPDC